MTTHNPYLAPRASVDDAAEEFQPVRVLSVSGRIGRARYILYTMGLPLLIMFLTGGLSAFLGQAGAVLIPAGWIAVAVISFMLTVQPLPRFRHHRLARPRLPDPVGEPRVLVRSRHRRPQPLRRSHAAELDRRADRAVDHAGDLRGRHRRRGIRNSGSEPEFRR